MNSCSNSTSPRSTARQPDFGDLESPMMDAEQLTDIVAHLVEDFTNPLWAKVRAGGGGAMVLITETELNRIIWTANECAYRTRQCREKYYEILEASFEQKRAAKSQVAA